MGGDETRVAVSSTVSCRLFNIDGEFLYINDHNCHSCHWSKQGEASRDTSSRPSI